MLVQIKFCSDVWAVLYHSHSCLSLPNVKGSCHGHNETPDVFKVFSSHTPRAIHQKNQIRNGTHWTFCKTSEVGGMRESRCHHPQSVWEINLATCNFCLSRANGTFNKLLFSLISTSKFYPELAFFMFILFGFARKETWVNLGKTVILSMSLKHEYMRVNPLGWKVTSPFLSIITIYPFNSAKQCIFWSLILFYELYYEFQFFGNLSCQIVTNSQSPQWLE